MKELSIFVDESGDFGNYDSKSPYYIVTFVLHEQENSINEQVDILNQKLERLQLGIHAIHTAPLVRREKIYSNILRKDRFRIFNKFFHFTRNIKIKYKNIIVDKKYTKDFLGINSSISKQLSAFVKDNLAYFQQFDKIIIYYDDGQMPLANILVSVFTSWFHNQFEYRTVSPYEYKLFQAADFICTLSLLEQKLLSGQDFTNSEKLFFNSVRDFRINYLKHLKKIKFNIKEKP